MQLESVDKLKKKIQRKSWWSTLVNFSGPDVHTEHSSAAKSPVKKKKLCFWVCWKRPIWDQTAEPRPFSEATLIQKHHWSKIPHKLYRPGLSAFVIARTAPSRKEKGTNWALMMVKQSSQKQKEKMFGW